MKYNLPESFEESYEHFKLPKGLKNTLVLSDIHIPYQHNPAVEMAIDYGLSKNIDSILLNGDVIDCYQLSKFQPDPRKRHFKDEIESFREFIKVLKDVFNVPIYYKLGNHEERYERIMIERCAEFLELPEFEFENILGADNLGVTVIKDQRIIYVGKLPVFHGHEVKLLSTGVNPARSLFLKIHSSGLCGHLHRTSQHTEPSIKEDIVCWSTGHLSEEHPKYARNNKWNHGIARIEKNTSGDFEVINFSLKKKNIFSVVR